MTIDLGNVNNGIPMGSYVGGGGGEDATAYHFKGSVDTYADLTAIINPSQGDVYDVKENGKNYAWTGEEWDDLGGTVAGGVSQEDLDKKEDKITALNPITLENKVISTLTGISETNANITTLNRTVISVSGYPASGTYYNPDGVYLSNIIQPYTFGQIVKYPFNNSNFTAVLFGHPTENENGFAVSAIAFPTSSQLYSGYDHDYRTGGININGCTELPSTVPASRLFSTMAAEHAANASTDKVDNYCYAQIIVGGGGELILGKYGRVYNFDRGLLATDVFRDGQAEVRTGSTAAAIAGITHVMWIFGNANSYYDKSLIGLYGVKERMPWNFNDFATFEANLGENLLDLTSNTSQNYLQLNIGDGLSVVDGKLTATSSGGSTPSNMVTTDTEQTISGVKTFSAGIKGKGYIENIGLTDLIYTDNNKNPHVGNTSRTLTVHTNPIGNGRILINDGSTNYEDIHTGNIANFIDGTSITFTNNKLSATSAGGAAPENMVTTDTAQEITGSKLFPNGLKVGGYAGISDNNGEQFIYVDTSHNGWTIGTQNSGGWFSDVHIKRGASGDYINIDSGNIGEYLSGAAPSNMVTTDTAQTITGKKTFTDKIQVGTLSRNLISTYNDILQIGARNYVASEIAVNADIIKDRDGNEYLKYSYNAFKQIKLTQEAYDALTTKDENTMYIIVG